MKNWNTDTTRFKSSKDKRIWELTQLINYGLDGTKLNGEEIKEYWTIIKPQLDPKRARMLEYLLWKKLSSLPSKKNFWGLSPGTTS